MKKYLLRTLIVASLVFGGFALLSGEQATAVESTTNNAKTMKISPLRTDLSIAPGKTGVVTVKVTNLTKAPITLQAIQNDFVAGDENGTPALILDEDKYAPTHSLKRFMVPLQNVTIPAEKTQEVKLTIKVPADANPGGYYGAVRFQPVNSGDSGQVNLNASAASLVLLTVPGDTVEKLILTDFNVMQGSKSDTIFQSANDLQLAFRLQNTGNIQEGPFGTITVKQGDEVIYSYDFNLDEPREMVLPDSARKWEVPLKNIGSFGNYTVTATLTYGKKNMTIEASKSFWVIPMYVIAIVIAGTLALIGLIVGIWLFLRSYKRRILNNQGRRGGGYRR